MTNGAMLTEYFLHRFIVIFQFLSICNFTFDKELWGTLSDFCGIEDSIKQTLLLSWRQNFGVKFDSVTKLKYFSDSAGIIARLQAQNRSIRHKFRQLMQQIMRRKELRTTFDKILENLVKFRTQNPCFQWTLWVTQEE